MTPTQVHSTHRALKNHYRHLSKLKRSVRYRKNILGDWLDSLPEEQKNTAQ